MSLVKFNQKRFPWLHEGISSWLDTDDFFGDDFFTLKNNLPAMNIKENEKSFEVELAVPGFSKKEIEISVENDVLHIYAQKEKKEEEKKEDYTYKEFMYNSLDRKLQLPSSVNQEQEIKATYKDGLLKLELAKISGAQSPVKKLIEIA